MADERVSNIREIENLIRARCPLIYVVSHEEVRVEAELVNIAQKLDMKLAAWSATDGFVALFGTFKGGGEDLVEPIDALDFIKVHEGRALFILRDFHVFLSDPYVVRKLRDLVRVLKNRLCHAIVLSPVMKIPSELE